MSTTAPADLEVPREFLPAFIYAATVACAEHMEEGSSLHCRLDARESDDAVLEHAAAAIAARSIFMRAYDEGESVHRAIIEGYVDAAIQCLRSDLHDDSESGSPDELAALARTLRDLSTWITEHDILTKNKVTA